jgi:dihydrofolate reductase
MGIVLLDMSISLDGYIAGSNGESGRLYDWYFAPESQSNPNGEIIEELVRTTGAIVMGKRAYGIGEESGGYEDDPYQVPNFVVTHHVPELATVSEEVKRRFVFVTDGVQSAVEQAKTAAGDRDVAIGGGADIAQQCLRAGLVDEIQLHVVPMLFGEGIRLFEHTGKIELQPIRAVVAPAVAHLRFRVLR